MPYVLNQSNSGPSNFYVWRRDILRNESSGLASDLLCTIVLDVAQYVKLVHANPRRAGPLGIQKT